MNPTLQRPRERLQRIRRQQQLANKPAQPHGRNPYLPTTRAKPLHHPGPRTEDTFWPTHAPHKIVITTITPSATTPAIVLGQLNHSRIAFRSMRLVQLTPGKPNICEIWFDHTSTPTDITDASARPIDVIYIPANGSGQSHVFSFEDAIRSDYPQATSTAGHGRLWRRFRATDTIDYQIITEVYTPRF